MQEKPQGNQFIPEAIDEQIAQLKRRGQRETADAHLVRDLEQAYREEEAEKEAIERIRQRLLIRATQSLSIDKQATQPLLALRNEHSQRKEIERMNTQAEKMDRQIWIRRWGVFAATVIAMLAVGSLLTVLQMARTSTNSGGSNVKPSKQQSTDKKPTVVETNQGMYLGLGNQVVKVDMQTKKVLWHFAVKSDPNDLPAFQQPQINTPPLVDGQNVYFTSQNGRLYALNVQTGKLLWEHNFQADVASIKVANGILYTSTYWSDEKGIINNVYALNIANGTIKTKYKASGSIADISDGIIYLNNANTLAAIKMKDGSQLWQAQITVKQNFNPNIYIKNNRLYASSAHISEKTANELQDSYAYTLDVQSGKITWQSAMMDGFVFDIAVGDDGRIYCGAQNHYVYAFDPTLKMNKELWKYHTIVGHVYPAPIIQSGVIYVGQSSAGNNGPNNDHLVALDAATGQQKWATPLSGYTGFGDNRPLVLYNGVIYLSTTNLLGFATNSGKQVFFIPTDALFSKKDGGANAFITGIAITIVP